MGTIDELRRNVDRVDDDILRLLNERMRLVEEIGVRKHRDGLAVSDPAREERILKRLKERNTGSLPPEAIDHIYREVFSISRSLEETQVIAFLGPEATFTHLAALKRFGRAQPMSPRKSVRDVFRAVEKGECHQGVVPIENSTEGSVVGTLDMLIDSSLKVVDEIYLEVHHHLLSRLASPGDVKVVFSHPQAISQCQEWLGEHLADVSLVEVHSTAEAARRALEVDGAAAIASEIAATLYSLRVIARRIEDRFDNLTRFIVIGTEEPEPTGRDKTSLLFSVSDRAGALHSILRPLAEAGVNLTRIESRPSRLKAWDYVFFVDMEGHHCDRGLADALSLLSGQCSFLKVLGSYPNRGTEEENGQ